MILGPCGRGSQDPGRLEHGRPWSPKEHVPLVLWTPHPIRWSTSRKPKQSPLKHGAQDRESSYLSLMAIPDWERDPSPKVSHISRKDILAAEKKKSTMDEKESWKSWQAEQHSSADQGTVVPGIGWGCAPTVLNLVAPSPATLTPVFPAPVHTGEKKAFLNKTTTSNLGAQQLRCGKLLLKSWSWGSGSISIGLIPTEVGRVRLVGSRWGDSKVTGSQGKERQGERDRTNGAVSGAGGWRGQWALEQRI